MLKLIWLGFAAVVLVAGESRQCHLVFHSNDGLHTVPAEGGEEKKIADSNYDETTPSSGLAVDGVRGLVIWTENDKILRKSIKGGALKVLARVTVQRGKYEIPMAVQGLALQTETHTAFGTYYDDRGGFRIFAFDYLLDEPELSFSWCGVTRCSVKALFPTGGSVAVAEGKVFVASSAGHKQRAYSSGGGAAIRWFTTGLDHNVRRNDAVAELNQEVKEHSFPGDIGALVADEGERKLFFTEMSSSQSRLWETDFEGTYVKNISGLDLPIAQSWTRTELRDGVPTPQITPIGGGRLAVANNTHIFVVDTNEPEAIAKVLYHRPSPRGNDWQSFLSPVTHYCENVHTGGRPVVQEEL